MTGWNLPPGVTGNEDIFGPDAEEPFDGVCGTVADLAVYTPELAEEVDRLFRLAQREGTSAARLVLTIGEVSKIASSLPVVEAVCPFEGEVDAAVFGRGPSARVLWTCPVCGAEHVVEGEDI